MGGANNKRWYNVIRARLFGRRKVPESASADGAGIERDLDTAIRDGADVQPVSPKVDKPAEVVGVEYVATYYSPPEVPEPPAPTALRGIDDGSSMMYVQTCFWVAGYVEQRSQRGDFTQDQLIEQFGVNVRRCINPEWKADA